MSGIETKLDALNALFARGSSRPDSTTKEKPCELAEHQDCMKPSDGGVLSLSLPLSVCDTLEDIMPVQAIEGLPVEQDARVAVGGLALAFGDG